MKKTSLFLINNIWAELHYRILILKFQYLQHVMNYISQTSFISLLKNKIKLNHKATSSATYGIANLQLMELFCITSNQTMNSECELATFCY